VLAVSLRPIPLVGVAPTEQPVYPNSHADHPPTQVVEETALREMKFSDALPSIEANVEEIIGENNGPWHVVFGGYPAVIAFGRL
jgi:hypothetical protein